MAQVLPLAEPRVPDPPEDELGVALGLEAGVQAGVE